MSLQSTESLVLEVLEELEEFTEREKNFEEKYVKTINLMKSEAEKTELELAKVGAKNWLIFSSFPSRHNSWNIFAESVCFFLDSTFIIGDNLYLLQIKSKMTECEEEIESLNSNLDTKNDFISALQRDNTNKREETEYLVNQLQKANNVVKWELILK